MHYLYAKKQAGVWRLVATFDSEQQLLAYVRWATLKSFGGNSGKFEQGSAMAGYHEWRHSQELLTDAGAEEVVHNPTPSML